MNIVTCRLHLSGLIDDQHTLDNLHSLLDIAGVTRTTWSEHPSADPLSMDDLLCEGRFDGGAIDEILAITLLAHGLSFVWTIPAHGDQPHTVTIGVVGKGMTTFTLDGDHPLVVGNVLDDGTVSTTPSLLPATVRTTASLLQQPLIFAPTAHARLKVHSLLHP